MKKVYIIGIIAVLIALAAIIVISYSNPIETDIVSNGYMEDAVDVTGIVVRDEAVLNNDIGGMYGSQCVESEKIAKGQLVGTIYKGEMSQETRDELNSINQKIIQLSGAQTEESTLPDDPNKIDTLISSRIGDIVKYSISDNGTGIYNAKQEINKLNAKKLEIGGLEASGGEDINALKQRRETLEANYNLTKKDVYAPIGGVYSSVIDGYEDQLKRENIPNMTVDEVDKLLKTDFVNKNSASDNSASIAKIVNNYNWNFVTVIDEKEVKDLKAGKTVYLRFSDEVNDLVECTIESIKTENGKALVNLSSDKHVPTVFSNRKLSCTFVRAKYDGLMVSNTALRVADNATVVYVIKNSAMTKRTVDVLYTNGEYAIVSDKSNDKKSLQLYDEVIIKAKEITDGKLVR